MFAVLPMLAVMQQPPPRRHRFAVWRRSWAYGWVFGLGTLLFTAPVIAADKIFFKYGPLVRSVEVSALEQLATEGEVSSDLAFYIQQVGATPAEVTAFRSMLQTSLQLDPVLISRFFYTDLGEDLLNQFGRIVTTRSGLSGKLAIRGALVQAAMSPEGLTAISFLRQLPTDMQLDVQVLLDLDATVERIVQATQRSVERMAHLTAAEAALEPSVDYEGLTDLTQPGRYGAQSKRMTLTDASRDRTFYVDLYWPLRWRTPSPAAGVPVVIYSHGLAASPEGRQDWGEFMASHGFFVAMPQHPGSDKHQVRAFRQGFSSQIFALEDFVERPADITAVIDELERRNGPEFEGRLNLASVGLMGHSFGGYTAMAVAGATIDFEFLTAACQQRFAYLNVSLLLQCQALQLSRQDYDFRDPRVGAVLGINPVESSVFGPDGLGQIQIPVALLAGSYDPATPAVFEQFLTFPWLTTPDRLLGLLEGQAHVNISELDAGISQLVQFVPELTLAAPDLIHRYRNAVTLAFFERYIARRTDYQLYLRSAYAQYLSQEQPFQFHMISDSSQESLQESIRQQLGLPNWPTPTPITPD